MIASGNDAGWLVAVFFGLCTATFVAVVAVPGTLVLSQDGLRVKRLWRTSTYEWANCGPFRTWSSTPRTGLVVFDYQGSDSRWRGRTARLSKSLSGANCALPDTYGRTAEDLATLLNEYRRRIKGEDA
jgi:hypothetical protein